MAEKLLIVDDSPSTLALFDATLSDSYTILTANDYESALQVFHKHTDTNLVLTDLYLGEHNGLSVIRELGRENPMLSAMLITGQANLDVAQKALNSGLIHRFTTKDVDIATLKTLLEECHRNTIQKARDMALIEQSMSGFVTVLLDLFHAQIPDLTPHSKQLRRYVSALSKRLNSSKQSQLLLAASLLWIGFLKLCPKLVSKVTTDMRLTEEEWHIFSAHGRFTHNLVARIPRLEGVARLIEEAFHAEIQHPRTSQHAIILKLCNDAVWLSNKIGPHNTANRLEMQSKNHIGTEFHRISIALACLLREHTKDGFLRKRELTRSFRNFLVGDQLLENLSDEKGTLLLSKGHHINEQNLGHLRMISKSKNISQPIRILREYV